jgi:hypothetical protein
MAAEFVPGAESQLAHPHRDCKGARLPRSAERTPDKFRLTMSNYQTRLIAKTLLTIELEPSLKEQRAKIAARNDETLIQVVRRALRQYAAANAQMELEPAKKTRRRREREAQA